MDWPARAIRRKSPFRALATRFTSLVVFCITSACHSFWDAQLWGHCGMNTMKGNCSRNVAFVLSWRGSDCLLLISKPPDSPRPCKKTIIGYALSALQLPGTYSMYLRPSPEFISVTLPLNEAASLRSAPAISASTTGASDVETGSGDDGDVGVTGDEGDVGVDGDDGGESDESDSDDGGDFNGVSAMPVGGIVVSNDPRYIRKMNVKAATTPVFILRLFEW
mmetsp:Transcript_32191/g.78426  ORF Transcript_32191/g.78426 Transcript_32191/m.78426 type:complete len:221 (-) Transcript_32191:174-836(-)